ncbi:MAG: hypothetical protein CL852_04510 [Crocinitomicaceae bacterium]|nr:hypothetical protein [Crocinitomicaceae bacterium]
MFVHASLIPTVMGYAMRRRCWVAQMYKRVITPQLLQRITIRAFILRYFTIATGHALLTAIVMAFVMNWRFWVAQSIQPIITIH